MTAPEAPPARDAVARVVHGLIAVGLIALLVLVGVRCVPLLDASLRTALLPRHDLAIIGVPLAIVIASALLCGLRAVEGRFHLRLLGFKRRDPRPTCLAGWRSSSQSSLHSARSGEAG